MVGCSDGQRSTRVGAVRGNRGLTFSHTHTLYFKRRGGERKNCQLAHISVILYKWAAIKSHGDTHVSTGGMVSIVHKHYTTYGLKTY